MPSRLQRLARMLMWGALVLPACGGGGLATSNYCRVACCGCSSDADCDEPRRCWPLTINGDTRYVCMGTGEFCLPSPLAEGVQARFHRLSFLPRFQSQVLDFSARTASASVPAPASGDLELRDAATFRTDFVRAGSRALAAIAVIGPVASIAEIAQAPLEGFGPEAPVLLGYGYVVRCEEGTYARMRVSEPIVERDGTHVGWILEWSHQPDGGRDFGP